MGNIIKYGVFGVIALLGWQGIGWVYNEFGLMMTFIVSIPPLLIISTLYLNS